MEVTQRRPFKLGYPGHPSPSVPIAGTVGVHAPYEQATSIKQGGMTIGPRKSPHGPLQRRYGHTSGAVT